MVYADTPFPYDKSVMSKYADAIKAYAFDALDEESILVVVMRVAHSE